MTSRRQTIFLVLLLLTHLALLTSQVRQPGRQRSMLEESGLAVVAPLSHRLRQAVGGVGGLAEGMRGRRELRRENAELRQQVADLTREQLRLEGIEREMASLANALGYKGRDRGHMRLAEVAYIDHTSWLKTLLLYLPDRWASYNSPVVAPEGLVGRVVLTRSDWVKVQMITDRASAVGAMIERTRRQGIVRGSGKALTLEYVPSRVDVAVGDRVVTSGTDGLYPRGLEIGVVVSVAPGEDLFHQIEMAPAVDFGRLDQVFVLAAENLPGGLLSTSSASP